MQKFCHGNCPPGGESLFVVVRSFMVKRDNLARGTYAVGTDFIPSSK